jgi:hypothetical protein
LPLGDDPGRLAHWPRFDRTDRILSLRVSGRSTTISDQTYAAEHQCGFWHSLDG